MSTESQQGLAETAVKPSFLVIGQIAKPHGVQGEMRVVVHTDLPERFSWLKVVYIGDRQSTGARQFAGARQEHSTPQPVAVTSVRHHQDKVLLKLVGYDDRDAAGSLAGQLLYVPESEAIPLEEGEYFLYQLEGLAVYEENGRLLGHLTSILETGANNVFIVRGDYGEILLPDIPEVILDIDFDANRMTIQLLDGLLPGQ
ncbi:MAG: ribosome maturation factor RimM [Chloroflexota bacterium]